MAKPTIGPMRYRITLEVNHPTRVGSDLKANWSTVGTYWASIRQLSGREAVNADRLKSTATHMVEMRYVVPILPTVNRLVFGSRVFSIEAANNVDERNRTWQLMAKEVKNPA